MAFEALLITCSIHQKHLPQIWLKIQILVNDCFDKRGKNTSGQTKLQQGDLQKQKTKNKNAPKVHKKISFKVWSETF